MLKILIFFYRQAYEKENKVTSPKEGLRSRTEAEALIDYQVPNSNLKIKAAAFPTLVRKLLIELPFYLVKQSFCMI